MLNEQQLRAVNTINGPLLSIACPGSGKTTMLIERTHNMVQSGIEPKKILVISFTQAAALEMRQRYESKYGKDGVTFGTIHSFCFSILRRFKHYTNDNILSPSESFTFFKEKLMGMGIPFSEVEEKVKMVQTEIGVVKNAELSIMLYESEALDTDDFRKLFSLYDAFKKSINKLDFDDMLVEAKELLYGNRQILEACSSWFDYISVDEFQDTNKLQADIIYALVKNGAGNLCVVGDDDQSLYKFRAADNRIFKSFTSSFPEAKIVRLSTNYRSLPAIIKASGNLIQYNKDRLDKDFLSFREGKAVVKAISCGTDNAMADIVCDEIEKLLKDGEEPEEIAVLYRTNQLSQMTVSRLLEKEISFRISDPPKDFHKEFIFHDIKQYWQFCNGVENESILKTVLYHPGRYFKKDAFTGCKSLDDCSRMLLLERDEKAVIRNSNQFDAIRRDRSFLSKKRTPAEFTKAFFHGIGYDKWLMDYADYLGKEFSYYYDIMRMIESEAASFSKMDDWFKFADTYADLLREKKKTQNGVTLSTFHSSKGLEWKHVFIIYADNNHCPSRLSDDPEEERRCFYVAMTRAKDSLKILWAGNPSPYLIESKIIGKGSVKMSEEKAKTVNESVAIKGPQVSWKMEPKRENKEGELPKATINPKYAAFFKEKGRKNS